MAHPEQRCLRPPGRARREADRRRPLVVRGAASDAGRAAWPGELQRPTAPRATSTTTSVRSGIPSTVSGIGDDQRRADELDQVVTLRRRDGGADAGEHGADRCQGHRGDQPVAARRQCRQRPRRRRRPLVSASPAASSSAQTVELRRR